MAIDRRITRTFASANGRLVLPINRPQSVGGVTYRLASVEWCLFSMQTGSKVDYVEVWADPPATTIAVDQTDRTTAGCYAIPVPATSQNAAYSMDLYASGGGTFGLATVRTTWVPVAGDRASDDLTVGTRRSSVNGLG